MAEIQEPVAQRDAGAAFVAELFAHVGLAVAVGVAQGDDPASGVVLAANRDEEIAVRRDRDMACRAERIGDHHGAEPAEAA